MQELKTATNDEMKMTIQREMEKVEGNIQYWNGRFSVREKEANEHEGRLGLLLKKEGEFRL